MFSSIKKESECWEYKSKSAFETKSQKSYIISRKPEYIFFLSHHFESKQQQCCSSIICFEWKSVHIHIQKCLLSLLSWNIRCFSLDFEFYFSISKLVKKKWWIKAVRNQARYTLCVYLCVHWHWHARSHTLIWSYIHSNHYY